MKPFLTAVLLAAITSSASAALIYSNGSPDTSAPNSRGITIFRVADDFALNSPATIGSVRFWMVAEPGHFSGSVTYAFYQNSGGSLGPVIDSATVGSITPVFLNAIPANIHSVYLVDFNLPSPLSLASGTYWLELHDGTSLTANNPNSLNVLWEIVGGGVVGNGKQNSIPDLPSNNIGDELAFELHDSGITGVPEPATISISLLGFVLIGIGRWRRS